MPRERQGCRVSPLPLPGAPRLSATAATVAFDVAVLLFFFFQGLLNVIVGGLWRRFEQLLTEGAPLVGVCLFHVEGFDDEVHEPFAMLSVRFLLAEEVGDDATEGCLAVE